MRAGNINPKSIGTIHDFLLEGAEAGLAVSTLKVQAAALSVFLNMPVNNSSLVKRLFKSIERARPSKSLRESPWDL